MSETAGPWAQEGTDIVRAMSGGLLFGIPLVFTMEVWWIGSVTGAGPMLAVLGLTFVAVLVLNRTSGFRSEADVRWSDAAMDAVEAVAVALVTVTVLLFVLQEIGPGAPIREALGKIIYESMPFGLGIGLAHHFLRQGRSQGDGSSGKKGASRHAQRSQTAATFADIGATALGAVFIAFSIAPTDEVPMLSAALSPALLGVLVILSLAISFAIVFVAGFSNQEQRLQQEGLFQRPVTETVAGYLISLVCAAGMLWLFQRLDPSDPWTDTLSHVLVLGLPACVGGAAGRLAV